MESDRADGVGSAPAESLELIDPREGDAPSDSSLLQRFVNLRDEQAFAELVRRHQGLVMNVGWRILRNVQAAEDAFQETFLALARRARTVRVPDSLAGWLHRVAANAALQIRIRGQRRVVRETLVGAPEAARPGSPETDDLARLVDKTLDEMPEKYRLPLILCFVQGLTNETAAVRLGRPKGSMSTLIARGLELLRNGLQKKGVVAVPGALIATLLGSQAQAATPAVVASVLRAASAAGLGATAVSSGATGWLVAAELKAAVAAALLAAGAVGGGLFALPPTPPPLPAIATVLPAPAAPARRPALLSVPNPTELRPALPPEAAPKVEPKAALEKKEERAAEKSAEADPPKGPKDVEALPPLPDLPESASDNARAALERVIARRQERDAQSDEGSGSAKNSKAPLKSKSAPPGLERAAEASRGASSASEQAQKAVQQTRGRSGK